MSLPPGPSAPALLQSLRMLRAPYRFLDACGARYGEVFTLTLSGMGKIVMTAVPEHIKQLFVTGPDVLAAGRARGLLQPIFGDWSLLTLDGEDQRWQRRFVMPLLHRDNLALGEASAIEATRRAIRTWPEGEAFLLYPQLEIIAIDVIMDRFLGFGEHPRAMRIRRLLLDFLRAAHAAPVFHLPGLIDRLDVGPWRRFRRLRRELDEVLHAALRDGAGPPGNLIGLLRETRKESGEALSPVEMRDIVMSIIVAGHETTAIALTWAFALALAQPGVAEEMVGEIRRVTGGEPLRREHLAELTFLDAVIKESMRLAPINPIIPRVTLAPLTLGEHVIPAGMHVAANSYGVHRRPDIFPDPDTFAPRRFLDAKPDHFSWIPFGGGARKCVGMAFALHEMKAVMATILTECPLTLVRPGRHGQRMLGDMAAPGKNVLCRRAPRQEALPRLRATTADGT